MKGKPDSEKLMGELFDFAEKMLNDYGEFHPFGGYLDAFGNVVHLGIQDDMGLVSQIDKFEIIKNKIIDVAKLSGILAAGIAANVSVSNNDGTKSDAIEFWLEHRDGYCAEVFIRYKKVDGHVEFIDTTAQRGSPVFFG